MSFDTLQELIRKKKNPLCVGLAPTAENIPPQLLRDCREGSGDSLETLARAAWEFDRGLIEALAETVPAVEVHCAYYERLGWRGMEALERTIAYAHERGLFVIADGQWGGARAEARAYGEAWLGRTQVGSRVQTAFGADCITVNGYMGSDGILPFLEICREEDKCFFVVVKTSNLGAGELQDLVAGDRLVYEVTGDLAQRLGRGTEGRYGYHRVGAVIGTAYPAGLRELRGRLENTFFLVPGYGAGESGAEDARFAFDRYGRGAILSASGPILEAWKGTGREGLDYQKAARTAAQEIRDELRSCVTIL